MAIIRDIQDLSTQINNLRDTLKRYDAQITNSEATNTKLNKMFAAYKQADLSAMSVEHLSHANQRLTEGITQLTASQDAYTKKANTLQSVITTLEKKSTLLGIAQRQALSMGDQQGAQQLYAAWVENNRTLTVYRRQLTETDTQMKQLNTTINDSSRVSERYKSILEALHMVKSGNSTQVLKEQFDKERRTVVELNTEITRYANLYKGVQASIKGGKLSPEDIGNAKKDLTEYSAKLQTLSQDYEVAARRARIFGTAVGNKHVEKIAEKPSVELSQLLPQQDLLGVENSVEKIKGGMGDIIRQATILAGMSFGVGGLTDLAKQVMQVRGEFQQLEITFETMLGSGEKAHTLMQQLTTTAAKTPFNLQGVAQGAKQLLAYGIEADKINDTLIHLGDIAAGLSIPLNDLVYLYGTTIVQGRMMTMDLRQFQNRGIPIAEELAKQFGVAKSEVQSLVSAGRVTADEFNKAIMSMSSEGGKFGGLMAAQSQSITGQISNIQDSISMMFNEIGKSSEGVINTALSGVSTLVENYQSVGKVILSLAATYGTYRAALVVVSAVEKAHTAVLEQAVLEKRLAAAANITLANSDALSASRKTLFTAAIRANTKALLKNTAAMLTNPAVLVTAGLVALVGAIYATSRALDTQARAQERVNDLQEQNKNRLEQTKQEADAAIQTIQSETATIYEKAKAYETLRRVMPSLTEQYTQQELATLSLTQAQQGMAKALEDIRFAQARKDIAAYEQVLKSLQETRNHIMAQGGSVFSIDNRIKTTEHTLSQLRNEYQEMIDLREKAKAEEEQKQQKPAYPLSQLISDIRKQEQVVEQARQAYAKNINADTKQALDKAEAALKEYTDKYKGATNQQWVDSRKLREQETKALQDARSEQAKIDLHFASARAKREQAYAYQTAALAQERAEYNRTHNGGTDLSNRLFHQRQENINLQYQIDTEEAERQFREWIKQQEQETLQIHSDIHLADMERAVDLADTYERKIAAQNALLQEQIRLRREDLQRQAQAEVEQQYGTDTAKHYQAYLQGNYIPTSDTEQHDFHEIEQVYAQYHAKEDALAAQLTQTHNQQQFDDSISQFSAYLDGMLRAEEDYQQRLADIRSRYGLPEDTDLSRYTSDTAIGQDIAAAKIERTRQEQIITRDTGISNHNLVEQLAQVGAQAAGKAMEEVRAIYDAFIADVNAEIDALEAKQGTQEYTEEDQQRLAQLTQVRSQAEQTAAQTTSNAFTKAQKEQQQTAQNTQALINSFHAVQEAANSIADTFGGALSEKSKKALRAMSDIADFGISAVQGISSLVSNVSAGVEGTTAAAVSSMSTLEKASFILTIISMAIQLITKIVEIASQFTASARMQEAIDQQVAHIEDLQRQHDKLERSYQSKAGTDYYKSMAKAAKDYTTIIREQNKAVSDAFNLYKMQESKYGEDSDKAKEAKEQYQELEDERDENIDAQKEAYKTLMEELSGTSLQSFSDNLADALIEGFAQGKEGINDVWEDTMDDLLRTMMRNQLSIAIQDMFKGTFEQLNEYTKNDGVLSQTEMDAIIAEMDTKSEQAKNLAEQYYNLMSERGLLDDDLDTEGSEGFGQMTQDQADTLTARFTALQVEGANVVAATQALATSVQDLSSDSKIQTTTLQTLLYNSSLALQIAQEQTDQLQIIADNTALLKTTNQQLTTIAQNTDRL